MFTTVLPVYKRDGWFLVPFDQSDNATLFLIQLNQKLAECFTSSSFATVDEHRQSGSAMIAIASSVPDYRHFMAMVRYIL